MAITIHVFFFVLFIFCFVCLCFLCLCFFKKILLHGEKLLVVLLLLGLVTTLLLLGTHHCAIVSGRVPCCDVAFGHFSSCFNSCLHEVKLLFNISK